MDQFFLSMAVVGTGQVLEGNVLTPKLVGGSVGLHPVWLMFALLAFGSLFGFGGMILAVPAAAAYGVLVRFAARRYKQSAMFPAWTSGEMIGQLPLDLRLSPRFGEEDFLESHCNAQALALVRLWPDWPRNMLLLNGSARAGKSHLGAIWAARAQARVVAAKDLDPASPPCSRRKGRCCWRTPKKRRKKSCST